MYPERHWRKLQGETINNQYHLQEYLGCGGYGAVYKADEVIKNKFIREVAIKLIAPEEDETKAEKQLTELTAAVNIHHENIIRSYTSGFGEVKEDEYLFIVMEIATTNLEKQRKTGKISPAEAIEIVKATAAALNYLHQSNPRKVHRDIKPANLLYVVNTWKVSDFGLLREISVKNSARTSDRRGTTLYVPPEAYDGVVATGWDMWSLGIMTAEILTGIAPFTADTEAQLMKKIMEEQPEIDWSKIPEPFTEIVRSCLEKERAKRWTAEQVLTALAPSPERSRRATPELTAPSPELTVPSPERSRRATPEPSPVPSPELTVPSPERSRRATPEPNPAPSPELTVPSPERSRRATPEPSPVPSPERSRRATPEPSPVPSPERSRRATPEPSPVPPETTRVVSAVGMDYTNLRNLLAAKKWKEADEETLKVMLKVAGREEEGWLNTKSIDNFPCEDLRTIDQLWVQYSNGRFGFSVQKRIYQSLGGTREYDEKVWEAFSDKVGWRRKNEWVYYKDLTFAERAPEAHLPGEAHLPERVMHGGVRVGLVCWFVERGCGGRCVSLFSLLSCRDLFTVPSPELTVPSPERSRRATPELKPTPPETTPMVSAVGMDYTNLRNLLAAKKWREADKETLRVMLKVGGREEEGRLNVESIDNFPCEDLRTIDQLWVKYSNGRFGFSVQKRIYQGLGRARKYDSEIWEKFGDKVGWRKKNEWLYYRDLTFSERAQEAHLPWGGVGWGVGVGVSGSWKGSECREVGEGFWWGWGLVGPGSLLSRRDL